MKAKHRKTIAGIFAKPTKANIKFSDIEALIEALGAREYAHRPHPGKEAKKYIVERIREWLTGLGVTP